jgi:hypothetical protein
MKSKKSLPDFSRTGMMGGYEGLDLEGLLLTLAKPPFMADQMYTTRPCGRRWT